MDKVYGEGETAVQALQNISFKVRKGEFMLIVGSSGSGKSTLLNMIGLLDRPTKGNVTVDGIDTYTLNDNQLSTFRNSKLGFIFQFSNLLSDLTVLENVMLPRKIQGTVQNAAEEARILLKTVGLENQMNKFANRISGGQSQRVALTRALINKPTIVLADEPTGNLDSLSAETTIHLLKSLNRKLNQTFIVVTHDRPQFGDVDKVVTIKDGKIVEGELEASMA
ncbi:MAG: ABC transporter ATP-binding protein [Thaumarchaeota archaeon]|nr:MAG: ABC transporter ATP-binding protein [Nitrososphaerota archaeon]TLX94034.1 MAG: ABC transporter ATP-binding protein [Nitrososphaerota archaeon]